MGWFYMFSKVLHALLALLENTPKPLLSGKELVVTSLSGKSADDEDKVS